MDLINYLKQDHDTIRILMHEADLTDDLKIKKVIFNELSQFLRTHFRAEELILYSKSLSLKMNEVNKVILDLYEEHRFIEDFIFKINSSDEEDIWKTRLKIFLQIVEINFDSKESDYFTYLRKHLSESELEQAAILYLKAKKFEAASDRSGRSFKSGYTASILN